MNLFSLGLDFGFGLGLGLGKRVRGKWGWGLKIYLWTGMEMKIIPANGGGPGMDGVFLSEYGGGDYTPRPRSDPLPSLRGEYLEAHKSEKSSWKHLNTREIEREREGRELESKRTQGEKCV